jgi:hypothetical protein
VPAEDKCLFLQDGDHAVGRGDGGDCQSCVGKRHEAFAGSYSRLVAVYCDASVVLLVTMVSVVRLKRLVQGLTLVAVTAYTVIVLYQSMSTAASSSRGPLRHQVRVDTGEHIRHSTLVFPMCWDTCYIGMRILVGSRECPLVLVANLGLKNGVFWDVTPCGSYKNRRFGGI